MNEEILPKLKYPFIDGLKEEPVDKAKDLRKIKTWMRDQPHLPYISDDYIHLFLHACYYHHDKTKHAIETYFTLRASTPSIFSDRDVYSESIKFLTERAWMVQLPKTTPEGYKVLMYLVKDRESTDYVFSDAIKGFCMYNDCLISENGFAEGYIVIFDMKNLKLGHLARVNLPVLRAFMIYIQEAHPARLKAIHVINTAAFIKHAMRIVTPMIRAEIFNLLKFHRGNVPVGIPQEILPKDFGGEAPSSEELGQSMLKIRDKYADWLKGSERFVADESKRIKKNSWWSMFSGSTEEPTTPNLGFKDSNAFRQLEID